MNLNQRIITIDTMEQAHAELLKLNCDINGIHIMREKAVFKTIKLEDIPTKSANLLKQTFLAKGGEVAIAKGSADLSIQTTDVLICATLKQYKIALKQLKMQPWGLPAMAVAIENVLENEQSFSQRHYTMHDKQLVIKPGHTLIMGMLNVRPDFSSGVDNLNQHEVAVKRVEELVNSGADIINIGVEFAGFSGKQIPFSAVQELEVLLPVLKEVISLSLVPISVTTSHSQTAKEALKLGAHMIRDIGGLQHDAEMAGVIAEYNIPLIIMHNQHDNTYGKDIVADICAFLQRSKAIGVETGINPDLIIVDPGLGIAKTSRQNIDIMSRLEELKSLGSPILLGSSRREGIDEVLDLQPEQTEAATLATVALGITKGVNIVSAHDVKPVSIFTKMMDAMKRRE